MAYMCQSCSSEGETWSGQCPVCQGKSFLNIAPKKPDMVGQLLNDRYKVVSKLGQGGMGTVYKAVREEVGQTLAIKVLNPEFTGEPEVVKRFLREVKTYGTVQHPNAVNLLDFGQTQDGALYIAMEFIAGQDLGRTISERGRLPMADAIDICVQCCDVLGHAHEKGIIHRDLKPENIMLVRGLRSYHAKVLDFGIARLVNDTATQLTIQGTICGTPRYMSPEQARGKAIDNRSDIYALGLVLFEMLTGRQAYTHTSVTDLLRAQVTEPVPHLWEVDSGRDLPEALDAVVQRAVAKNRDERFISMGQFADALSKAIPTMQEMRPLTDSAIPALDPAAPGRTFLGPGAIASATPPPASGLTNPTYVPSQSGQQVIAEVSAAGRSEVAIPAAMVARSVTPGPVESLPTQLKMPTPPALTLDRERPVGRPSSGSKAPIFIGLGLAAAAGIAAAILIPRLSQPAEQKPVVVPVASAPVTVPAPPQPVATAPAPTPSAPPAQPAATAPTPVTAQAAPAPGPAPTTASPAPSAAPRVPAATVPATAREPGKSRRVAESSVVNDASRAIREEAMRAAYTDADNAFIDGQLNAAQKHLDTIVAGSAVSGDADKLREKVQQARSLLEAGKRAADSGDCDTASRSFQAALKLSVGLREARLGLEKCSKAAVPTQLDP